MKNDMIIKPLLTQLYDYLKSTYQNNLKQIILFGSEARGNATSESDIDILIVLEKPFNYREWTLGIGYYEKKTNAQSRVPNAHPT